MLKRVGERVLLACGGVAVAFLAAELLIDLGYWAVRGHRFPVQHYRSEMLARQKPPDAPGAATVAGEWGNMVIHPYLGFVADTATTGEQTAVGDPSQVVGRSATARVVGVFGGSFAAGLCRYAGAELRRVLAEPHREVRLICAASAGYKQPQQFLALSYLLAQGGHFDLVINVDGFNEVALPPLDNLPQHVAPIYPRAWFWLVGDVRDPRALKLLGTLSVVDSTRRDWADLFARWGLDRSRVLGLVWERRDRALGAERDTILEELLGRRVEQRKSYATTGPTMEFADDQSLYEYTVKIWQNSSRQMQRLCDANEIEYHHFLQPNQHVPGAKPMGPEELRLAGPGFYNDAVVRGYPLLRTQGAELARSGVRFHDLTMVFRDAEEPLYSDGCCHLKPAGYNRIARAIGEAISSAATDRR